ncbi:monocarboxylate transporter 13-like [Asterias rubens]|uniref:monocarboxylate transporter 13-like n=1 Tax=Asterias rubens TaxID=7604 RepID=UPI001454F57B|nr:monocarboxylate transporter 13-like [Asterias rubens]XP_033638155.1 monocarboxylate transporter 13-like [Asterias rubens]XP_033638156.1 monocarboxylate transporter 13-like [Asterias rubens]
MKFKKHTIPVEPPDGGWGWIVAIGSNLMLQCVLITRSIGVFFIEWKQSFGASAAEVGAVGSVHMASFLFIGPFGGYLCRRFGSRRLALLGGVIAFTGMILASQSKTLSQLMLSFGFLTGIGCGFGYISAQNIISKYFKKRFAIANGISSAGLGFAIMVFPVLARFLIDLYDWEGAMLVFAGIVAHIIAMGMLFRPLRRTSVKKATNHVESSEEQIAGLQPPEEDVSSLQDEVISTSNDEVDANGSNGHSHRKDYTQLSTCASRGDGQDEDDAKPCRETLESHRTSNNYRPVALDPSNDSLQRKLKQRRPTNASIYVKKSFRQFIRGSGIHLIKSHHCFNLICLVQLTNGMGYSSVMTHIVAYAIYAGVPELDAAILLSIIGVGSLIGRLISGPIIDFKIISAVKFYPMVVFIAGLSVVICPLVQSFAGLVAIVAILGISTGIYKALNTVLIRLFLGADLLSLGIGLFMPYMGIGSIVGPIFVGWLYDINGKYNVALHVSGSITMIGAFSFLLLPYLKKIEQRAAKKASTFDKDLEDVDVQIGSTISIPDI